MSFLALFINSKQGRLHRCKGVGRAMNGSLDFSRITLRGLRIFVALEEHKSISLAAKNLSLSKSNISQAISDLEKGLGMQLFDRRQRPVSLTPSGQLFSHHAHRILSTVSEAETALAEFSAQSLPVLNFATIDDLDASLAPVVATALQAQLPRSFISTFSGRSDQVTARLMSRESDIGVTGTIPAMVQKFQVQHLYREQFVLVIAKDRYRSTQDWREQLTDLPFVHYSDTMPLGQLVATHLKRIGFEGQGKHSFETSRSVIATVARLQGWTIATPLSVLDASRFLDLVDLHPLPFAGLSRNIFLINRINELGGVPEFLASKLRQLLQDELLPEFIQIAPHLADKLEIER